MASAPTQTGNSLTASVDASAATRPPRVGPRVFQNTLAQLAGRGVGLLFSAATSILLARFLGRERMGEYGAIFAYVALFSFLATFSLEPILVREVSRRRTEAAQIFHTGTMVALSFGLAGAVLASLLAPFFAYSGRLHWLVMVAALDLLIAPSFRLPGIVFQVDMKQWFILWISLLRQVLWLAAVMLLALRHAAFYEVIVARTVCGIIEAAISLKVSHRRALTGPRHFDWGEARQLICYGYPLVLTALTSGIYLRIDQVMLYKLAGAHTLGPYVVAAQLTEQFGALPVALFASLAPVLAVTVAQEQLFRHYLGLSYRFLIAVVLFVCAVITPIIGPLVALLYGNEFRSSASLINILIWSEVPLFLGVVLANALVAKNLQRFFPISALVGAVFNIGLNLVLIPHWGALGASWATVISYACAAILMYLCFKSSRTIAWQGLSITVPPLLMTLAITFALQFWTANFVVKCLAAAVLYAAGVWLTGTVRKSEVNHLMEIVRRTLSRMQPSEPS